MRNLNRVIRSTALTLCLTLHFHRVSDIINKFISKVTTQSKHYVGHPFYKTIIITLYLTAIKQRYTKNKHKSIYIVL